MASDFQGNHAGCEGADALIARLTTLPGASQAAAVGGMAKFAEEVFLPYNKENDVPFEYGDLRSSADVRINEAGDTVLIEYGIPGSPAETYAVEQHERTDYHHEFGRAKYLEVPLQEWAERFIEAARESVRSILTVTAGPWSRESVISQFPGWASMQSGNRPYGVGAAARATKAAAQKAGPRLIKKGAK